MAMSYWKLTLGHLSLMYSYAEMNNTVFKTLILNPLPHRDPF